MATPIPKQTSSGRHLTDLPEKDSNLFINPIHIRARELKTPGNNERLSLTHSDLSVDSIPFQGTVDKRPEIKGERTRASAF